MEFRSLSESGFQVIGYFVNAETVAERRLGNNGLSRTKTAMLSTIAWMLIGHLYRWVHVTSASHDSLLGLNLGQSDLEAAIKLGRFAQVPFAWIRGEAVSPFLAGLFGTLCVAVAVAMVVSILNIHNKATITLISGVMSTNATVALLNATYIDAFDIYMLAMLLAVQAVYFTMRFKLGFILGAIAAILSLGLQQSFIQVTTVLAILVVLQSVLQGNRLKMMMQIVLRFACMLILSGIGYYLILKATFVFTEIQPGDTYNGISSLTRLTLQSALSLTGDMYLRPIIYLLAPETQFTRLIAFVNVFVGGAGLICTIWLSGRRRLGGANTVLSLALVALIPLGMNWVFIATQGMQHGLTIYSFFFIYIFTLMMLEEVIEEVNNKERITRTFFGSYLFGSSSISITLRLIATMLIGTFLVSNILYSNSIYIKKDLISMQTLSTMTRVIDRIEQMDGYEPGETQVVLIGSLNNSSIAQDRSKYPPQFEVQKFVTQDNAYKETLPRGTGLDGKFSVTYWETYDRYFTAILGYRINLADKRLINEYSELDEVKEMDSFPSSKCCKWIDNSIVFKLS